MAVSIWEGSKAQELIDAIKDSEKVNKYQGSVNAGKSLVVGEDGLVSTGDVNLPDSLKSALILCFQNTAWTTDNAQAIYNNLYRELYKSYTPKCQWYVNYRTDGTGNAMSYDRGLFYKVRAIDGVAYYRGVCTNEPSSGLSFRKSIVVDSGYAPVLTEATLTDTGVYPIPIPSTAVKFTIETDIPNAEYMATIFKYPATVDDILKYERVSFVAWTNVSTPMTFTSAANQVLGFALRKSDNSVFEEDEDYNIAVRFE